ncbi:MAG: alginate lyase family protein [Pseudomonadota bacterium]
MDALIAKPPPAQIHELPSDQALLDAITPAFGSPEDVAAHLRGRRAPRFFAGPEEIRRAVETIARDRPAWRQAAVDQAAELAQFRVSLYGREARLASAADWRALPLGPGADRLYSQRPHRFAFAPRLALAALHGAPARATLKALIESWCQATYDQPNPLGYASAHVAVHRMLALIWGLAFLGAGPESDDGLEPLILKILLCDIRLIAARQPSATPNNHLMAESFALWLFGTLYPEFRESRDWRLNGQADFLAAVARQVYPDGTSFEHSVHYHEHACELVFSYLLLCRRNGLPVADWLLGRARGMVAFQSCLSGPEGRPLALGGAIEDPILPLDAGGGWAQGAWRLLGRALFDRQTAPPREDDFTAERGYWLLGGQVSAASGGAMGSRSFPDGGYDCLAEAGDESRLIFRSGPAEGAAIAPGHMQADLLSVYLSLRATPVIVPSGTYTYRSDQTNWPLKEPNWRRHFIGPGASNGLVIEGADPLARRAGDFPGGARGDIKSRVVARHRVIGRDLAWVEGEVIGETPYSGHRRAVVHVPGCYWVVIDRTPPDPEGRARWLHFQLPPDARIDSLEGGRRVRCGDVCLDIAASPDLAGPEILNGIVKPPAGWVAPSYGVKQAAPLLRYAVSEEAGTSAIVLAPGGREEEDPIVELTDLPEGGLGVQFSRGTFSDTLLFGAGADQAVEAFGLTFRGELLWLRSRGGRPPEVRWLGGVQLSAPHMRLEIGAPMTIAELKLAEGAAGLTIAGAARADLTLDWPES